MKPFSLPRKEYILTERDFLRMMTGYLRNKQGSGVGNKYFFDKGDFVLTLEIKEEV